MCTIQITMMEKKDYPSQKRYLDKNPVVSFRLTKEEKEKLDAIADGEDMTPGQYVRNFLKGIIDEREKEHELYDRAFHDGLDEGEKVWQIWYYCNVCGEQIDIEPQSESHKKIIRLMKESRWGHKSCHDKKKEAES